MRILVLVVLGAMACSKSEPARGADDHLAVEVKSSVARLTSEIAKATTANGERLSDFRTRVEAECSNVLYLDKLTDATLAADYKKLCQHDIQVTLLRLAADRAEAARKAKPDSARLDECFDSQAAIAANELERNHTADTDSRALQQRIKAACPPVAPPAP